MGIQVPCVRLQDIFNVVRLCEWCARHLNQRQELSMLPKQAEVILLKKMYHGHVLIDELRSVARLFSTIRSHVEPLHPMDAGRVTTRHICALSNRCFQESL